MRTPRQLPLPLDDRDREPADADRASSDRVRSTVVPYYVAVKVRRI